MSLRKPPPLADWLLNRLRLMKSNPPLAGDLLEEFQSGRSRAWYWRQTIVAITDDLRRNVRGSRSRLMGILLAWIAQSGIAFMLWRAHLPRQVPPEFFKLAAMVVLSALLFFVGALGRHAKRKVLYRLSRSGFWFFLPLFNAVGFIARLDGNDRERSYRVLAPVVRIVAYLGVYCLVAACAPLKLSELVLLECVWFVQDLLHSWRFTRL